MALDPLYSNVALLLLMDGADGSTTFKDSSKLNATIGVGGDFALSTTYKKFGMASLFSAGTAGYASQGYLSVPDAPVFDSMTSIVSDFTFECWVRKNGDQAGISYIYVRDAYSGPGGGQSYIVTDSSGVWAGVTIATLRYESAHIPLSTAVWHHLALSRTGSTITFFVDGVPTVVKTGVTALDNASVMYIGGIPYDSAYPTVVRTFKGNIDEVRFTAGVGRYTTTFTPTTVGFSQLSDMTLTLPMLTTGDITAGTGDADLTLPALTLEAYAAAAADLTLPVLTLDATASGPILADASLTLPSLSLSASGTKTESGNAALTLSSWQLVGYGGAVCSVTIGSLTLQASGTTGSVGGVQAVLPLFELSASGTTLEHGSFNLILPSMQTGASRSGAALMLAPMVQLTAIGTAVVAVTYEAYAVNLKHNPQPGQQTQPIDEMTHYTNYPFTQIVRYRNSYYGVAADGLYLLEGTTDNGAPTTWDIQTAIHDWKTPLQKTAVSGYFGGRFSPSATVRLVAGDGKVNKAYAYSTPRGSRGQNYREFFGKGIRARYFALGATGSGELELDNIETEVHNTTRRI